MSIELNISLVQEWVEQVWNSGDLAALHQFHPPTFQNEGQTSNITQAKEWHQHIRVIYSDLRYTLEDIFATEERVAIRWTATGTHRGTLWGLIPPTGKQITWKGFHLLKIEQGKIVDIWAMADTMAQLQQMGVKLQPGSDDTLQENDSFEA